MNYLYEYINSIYLILYCKQITELSYIIIRSIEYTCIHVIIDVIIHKR